MRVSTSQFFQQSVESMLARQRELSQTQQQVADGKRIQRPSDDAAAAVRVLDIKESVAQLQQYQRNADAATARLNQEETALVGVENLLQRVRELAVRGASDSLSDRDRRAIAAEVREQREYFLQLANTQDANGEYLFAGFTSRTRPFSLDAGGALQYAGDQGQRKVAIGSTREVAVGDPGTLFMDFEAAAGGTTDIGSVLSNLIDNLESGNGYPQALADIDTAFTELYNTRAKIGARMNAIDEQKTANESFLLALSEVRSSLEDLDYAEAISRFNQQLTALQASQQAFMQVQNLSLFNFLR